MKLIPTIHPASILRQSGGSTNLTGEWATLGLLITDFRRALTESWTDRCHRTPTRHLPQPTIAEAREVLRIGDERPFYLDIETSGPEDGYSTIRMVGVARSQGATACLPWVEPYISALAAVLRDPSCPKVAHNSPFDFPRLEEACGLKVAGEWWDTAAQWSLLEPDIKNAPGMNRARKGSEKYCVPLALLGSIFWDGDFLWKEEHAANNMTTEDYCNIDVDVTARAQVGMQGQLKSWGMWDLFRERTGPAVKTCVRMGQRGIRVDRPKMEALHARMTGTAFQAHGTLQTLVQDLPNRRKEADRLRLERDALLEKAFRFDMPGTKREAGKLKTQAKRLEEAAGKLLHVNLNSPQQLKALLYDELGFPPQRLGKKSITTNDDALLELLRQCANKKFAKYHDVIEAIREYREVSKALGTYLAYDSVVLHPQLLVWGTATGRLSCVEPNLQNIPKRKWYAKELRSIFVPSREGNVFVAADYSQIELRITAWLAGDHEMLAAFESGRDIHQETAEYMGVSRIHAKTARYGWRNGMGYMKLQREFAKQGKVVTPKEAKDLLRGLDAKSPRLAEWRTATVEEAGRNHVLTMPSGRKRWFYEPSPYGEAIGTPTQAQAADVINGAMASVEAELGDGDARLVLQVHDELIVECPPNKAGAVGRMLQEIMTEPVKELDGMVFPVEVKSGPSLGELK